jgi:3-dehydroquinate synthase
MLRRVEQRFGVGFAFPVIFTRGAFQESNRVLRDTLESAGPRRHRLLLVVDSHVADADGALLDVCQRYARAHSDAMELVGAPFLVRGGEICKSDPVEVDAIHRLVAEHRIDRQSFVLAVGGGAVLDAAGYAAATAHRGVRLIRMPTTTLAQNDAGVGVKNGVNAFGRKNFLGTFAPPFAVINDFDFLRTLSPRDRRAGIAEAVKVAAIKDAEFMAWLYRERHNLGQFQAEAMEQMIVRCAERHVEHVGGADPFEMGSARPLDFGHWAAHKLEEITGNELRHGEAVAIGCVLDSHYAFQKGLLSELELGRIVHTIEDIGFDVYHPAMARLDVGEALEQFREHLGGELCITLPDGIGRKVELHEIDIPLMRRCVLQLAERQRRNEERKGQRHDAPGAVLAKP